MADDDGAPSAAPAPAPATPPATAPQATSASGMALTQEYVDTLVKDRVARARETERAKFSDYDDNKAKAARLDAIEAENASTLDKERAKARAEGSAEVLTKANSRLVAAEVRAQAAGLKFRDPLDALAHLTTAGKLADVKVDDDGNVDGAAITTALTELATAKAYLLDGPPAPPPTPTPGAAGVGAGSSGGASNVTPGMGRLRSAYETSGKAKT